MCDPVTAAVVMGGAGMASAISGQRDQDKAMGRAVAQQNAQKQEIVRQMNYEAVAGNQEKRDQFDQAVVQLSENSINAIRNQGMLQAAFAESGVEGRSVDAVLREARGQEARNADSTRAGYENVERGINYNIETGQLSTIGQIKGMGKIEGPSTASRVLGVINGGLQGASTGASMYGSYQAATAPKTGANRLTGGHNDGRYSK